MASRDEYAHWCMRLMEGDDIFINDMMAALYEDGYIDENEEWIGDDEEDE